MRLSRPAAVQPVVTLTKFWAFVLAVLGGMAVVQFVTASNESQTFDESIQLLSGYSYLVTGDYTVVVEHPPLLKLLWAAPVAMLHPDPPASNIWVGNQWDVARRFLYHNRVPADTILMAGRSAAILISFLLGVAIAFWSKRHFGIPAALLAVVLYACDPNFLANGRYIKNDVGAALVIFVAVMTWGAYLMNPSRRLLLLSGVALGIALCSKLSAMIVLPVMLALYALKQWQNHEPFDVRKCARAFGVVAAVTLAIILAVYSFRLQSVGRSPESAMQAANTSPHAGVPLPWPAALSTGLRDLWSKQTDTGLPVAYLFGQQSKFGWWYLSPVALAVKTPVADIFLLAVSISLAALGLKRRRPRDVSFVWYLLILAAAAYFTVSLFTHFNAGLRHLLPIYPFVFVAIAGALLDRESSRGRYVIAAIAVVVLAIETASIHPHYLAFFNAFVGGPENGRRILVDSNLDWGQDAKNLKKYLDEHGIDKACISYFGMADLDYYQIKYSGLPPVPDAASASRLNCVAAISVTSLALQKNLYAGLEDLVPDAQIGHSIYVYDLRKRATPDPNVAMQ